MAILACLRQTIPTATLLVTGFNYSHYGDRKAVKCLLERASRLGIPQGAVKLAPPFNKQEAPAVLNRAHILLHPVCNDICPNLLLEAMACGLPIVYYASGGLPELVPEEAGIGIPVPLDWGEFVLPEPTLMAVAVIRILVVWERYSAAARHHVCVHFELSRFINKHAEIFSGL